MAILVLPGDKSLARAIALPKGSATIAAALGADTIERWPYQFMLDTVVGPSGKRYRFDIWVDEAGLNKRLEPNLCASIAAHPLNECRGRMIYGPALLLPLSGSPRLALKDWGEICRGVWAFGDSGDDEDDADTRETLVVCNANGPTAAEKRLQAH